MPEGEQSRVLGSPVAQPQLVGVRNPPPRPGEAGVVVERLEHRDRVARDDEQLVRLGVAAEDRAARRTLDQAVPLLAGVARRDRCLDQVVEHRLGTSDLAGPPERHAQLALELEAGRIGVEESKCPLEEIHGGGHVLERECALSRRAEQASGTRPDRAGGVVDGAELVPVPVGLLEVVADQLSGDALALEERGSTLVQVGPHRLRNAGIRGVANQRVAEAEAVVAWHRRSSRLDQITAREREEHRPDRVPFIRRRELGHAAAPELLARARTPARGCCDRAGPGGRAGRRAAR